MKAIKGTIFNAKSLSELQIIPEGYIVYDETGRICFVGTNIPHEYETAEIIDYGNAMILQAFCDMHLHAPQYRMIGSGMDLELLDWLNTYTFPEESRYSDINYARKTYCKLTNDLLRNGTTRFSMFSSIHPAATILLMDELEKAGLYGYVGKVNMDRNGSKIYQETTKQSMYDTLYWLDQSKRFQNIRPILTPRFTPTCSDELMDFLGQTAKAYDLPVQSHLSENRDEISWVKELCPDSIDYFDSYAKFGLWTNKTLMAHCIHCTERELNAIRDSCVTVVHCPDSNINVCSGIAPVKKYLTSGIQVTLGSDIAGGSILPLYRVAAQAIRSSKCLSMITGNKGDILNVEEAYYLATSAGQLFFDEKPGFALGNSLHAVIVDDSEMPEFESGSPNRLERFLYTGKSEQIISVYAAGNKIN